MTNLTEYGKGCSPSAIQLEDGVTYEPGGELAEKLEHKIARLKELLKECREILDYAKDFAYHDPCSKCITKIDQVLGEE